MKDKATNYEHKVIDASIGYFRFFKDSTWEDYQAGLDDLMKIISDPNTTSLVVRNDHDGKWDKKIEDIWIETGKMLDKYGIGKWGVVVSNSIIREMTMKRVLKQGKSLYQPKYEYFIDKSEERVLNWINGA